MIGLVRTMGPMPTVVPDQEPSNATTETESRIPGSQEAPVKRRWQLLRNHVKPCYPVPVMPFWRIPQHHEQISQRCSSRDVPINLTVQRQSAGRIAPPGSPMSDDGIELLEEVAGEDWGGFKQDDMVRARAHARSLTPARARPHAHARTRTPARARAHEAHCSLPALVRTC